MTLTSKITSLDLFGYNIEFSFKKKQGQYKTPVGGTLTVIMGILVGYLIYNQLFTMYDYQNDAI